MMHDSQNPYAAPQADLTPPPGVQWSQDLSPSLTQTRRALDWVYFGIVAIMLTALPLFGLVNLVNGKFKTNQAFGALIMMVAMIGILLGFLLMIVGPLLCSSVPVESRAKGLALGCCLLEIPSTANATVYLFAPKLFPSAVTSGMLIFNIAGFIAFLLFLGRFACYIDREDLRRRAHNLLIGVAVLAIVVVVTLAATISGLMPDVGTAPGVAIVLGAFVALVVFANLVNEFRSALAGK
jgi:hypothetical protein